MPTSIAVVDDEPVIAETLSEILRRAGYVVRSYTDPNEAWTAILTSTPDLLISDAVMPTMSGTDLAIRVRTQCPHCKVLLLSGRTEGAALSESARRMGFDFYHLTKPVHPTDLLREIELILQS
jgi:CheY-like chemotaxis protein